MAGFSLDTYEILMYSPPGLYGGDKAQLARIPTDPDATIAFAHEYVHFLQAISSVSGFRLLGELLDFGIKAALVLADIADPDETNQIAPNQEILPLLRAQRDHSGRAMDVIKERADSIRDEMDCVFATGERAYAGERQPWQLDSARVTSGGYTETFFGFVTPRCTFRPFNNGLLAEGMARRIDRWLATNHGFDHVWRGDPDEEAEVYDGLRTVLGQPQFAHQITPRTIDRLTVVISYLALATPRADRAVEVMLARLADRRTAGLLVQTVGNVLAKELIANELLDAAAFNEVMDDLVNGKAVRVMARSEYVAVYNQLTRIQLAANFALSKPDYFADDGVTWSTVRGWMQTHSVGRVVASDGPVDEIDGIPCRNDALALLQEIQRVCF